MGKRKKPWGEQAWSEQPWKKRNKQPWSTQPWGEQHWEALPALRKKPTPSWKRSSSGSAAQPDKKHKSEGRPIGSAARPATQHGRRTAEQPAPHAAHVGSKARKVDCGESSAARPAYGAKHAGSKRIKPGVVEKAPRAYSTEEQFQGERLLSSVAYVKLPTFAGFGKLRTDRIRAGRSALHTIRDVKEAGADIINIVFERAGDMDSMWNDFNMEAETQQMGFFHHRLDKLLTLRSTNCGPVFEYAEGFEGGVPAIWLHLEQGPHENLGDIIIVNAACPQLPNFARYRRTKGPCHVLDS